MRTITRIQKDQLAIHLLGYLPQLLFAQHIIADLDARRTPMRRNVDHIKLIPARGADNPLLRHHPPQRRHGEETPADQLHFRIRRQPHIRRNQQHPQHTNLHF